MQKITTLLCLFVLLCPSLLFAADETPLKAEAAVIIKAYVSELKGALTAAIAKGGPVMAMDTCRLKAPKIAKRLSDTNDWRIGRTSLKTRNPKNRPDAWEKAGLEAFEKDHLNGVPIGKLVRSAFVTKKGGHSFRFLKAISTGALCLKCHGDQLAPDVQKALKKNYPLDKATGFRKKDIRGAFTLSKPLN